MFKNGTERRYRILFVDDVRAILLGLERLLRQNRDQWDMSFANSPEQALEMLAAQPFDIIVSDVVMPNMNGVELLEIVKEKYPGMIRFILSGHADHHILIQSVGATHQFMSKPCERSILTDAISRALALRDLFRNEDLLAIVKDATSIPTLPELYHELTEELSSATGTADRVAEIISRDLTVTAKVLQLVNSAFFGLSREIGSIGQAVSLLGAQTINSIVLTTTVFNQFSDAQLAAFNVREIFAHSIRVGARAAAIAKSAGLGKQACEEALLAGMMHDIGTLMLIDSDHDAWKKSCRDGDTQPFYTLEREILGITHAEIGAYILGVWGLPNTIVEAVAFHHVPGDAPQEVFGPLAAVYIANMEELLKDPQSSAEWDEAYLDSLNLPEALREELAG